MTGSHPRVDHLSAGPARPDGNDADLRYLAHAHAALGPVVAACSTALARGGSTGVRALARSTWVEQTYQLAAIAACLDGWRAPGGEEARGGPVDALAGLHGAALDRAFADQLRAHAHASIAAARSEMVAGASRGARQVAEHVIHAEDRRLAALERLHPADAPAHTPAR